SPCETQREGLSKTGADRVLGSVLHLGLFTPGQTADRGRVSWVLRSDLFISGPVHVVPGFIRRSRAIVSTPLRTREKIACENRKAPARAGAFRVRLAKSREVHHRAANEDGGRDERAEAGIGRRGDVVVLGQGR